VEIPIIPGWVQPAVSTVLKNPAFRVYKYSRGSTFELIDYDQYYFDLPEANQNGYIQWKLEYTFSKAYNKNSGLNGEAMAQIFQSMQKNQTAFNVFARYLKVGMEIEKKLCEPKCKQRILSVIKCTDMEEYEKCANQFS
jgi:hypothetical protein